MMAMKSRSDRPAATNWPNAVTAAAAVVGAIARNIEHNLARWGRVLVRAPQAQIPGPAASAIVGAIVTVVAVIGAMFVVDRAAANWAEHLPRWFKDIFEHVTDAGLSGWVLIPCAAIVLCLAAMTSASLPRFTQATLAALAARFGFLFFAVAAPGLFTTIVKRLIGRARPYVDIHGDPFTYMPFIWRSEYASLPSGHSTASAAAAFAIGAIWPQTRPIIWLYPLVIMFSRVVVNAHHVSDVLAGALVGVVGAALVRRWFAARCLVFRAPDLSAYPGPSLRRIAAAVRRALAGPWRPAGAPCRSPIEPSRDAL